MARREFAATTAGENGQSFEELAAAQRSVLMFNVQVNNLLVHNQSPFLSQVNLLLKVPMLRILKDRFYLKIVRIGEFYVKHKRVVARCRVM